MGAQGIIRSLSIPVVYAMVLFVLMGLAGCGYFNAGEWHDDPKNWERAFKQKPPEEIEVLHSYYWKSPHWTYEFEYFFALSGTQAARDFLLAQGQYKKVDRNDFANHFEMDDFFHQKPSWFLPKTLDDYEIWIFREEPRQHFRLFIDKKTGEIFMTDYSV